jgi:hypothetical protein
MAATPTLYVFDNFVYLAVVVEWNFRDLPRIFASLTSPLPRGEGDWQSVVLSGKAFISPANDFADLLPHWGGTL